MPARPLYAEQLLRAGICAAELAGVAGAAGDGKPLTLSEGWTTVTAAGVGHASYAISGVIQHTLYHAGQIVLLKKA